MTVVAADLTDADIDATSALALGPRVCVAGPGAAGVLVLADGTLQSCAWSTPPA